MALAEPDEKVCISGSGISHLDDLECGHKPDIHSGTILSDLLGTALAPCLPIFSSGNRKLYQTCFEFSELPVAVPKAGLFISKHFLLTVLELARTLEASKDFTFDGDYLLANLDM